MLLFVISLSKGFFFFFFYTQASSPLQHISPAEISSFKLSTQCDGLVIYLGMYVAFFPRQQILSDIDIVPAAAIYLTSH